MQRERFRSDHSEGCPDSGCLPIIIGVDSSGSLVKEMRKLRPRDPGGGNLTKVMQQVVGKGQEGPKRIL